MRHRTLLAACVSAVIIAGAAVPVFTQSIGPHDPPPEPPTGKFNATQMPGGGWDCSGGCYSHYCCVIRHAE